MSLTFLYGHCSFLCQHTLSSCFLSFSMKISTDELMRVQGGDVHIRKDWHEDLWCSDHSTRRTVWKHWSGSSISCFQHLSVLSQTLSRIPLAFCCDFPMTYFWYWHSSTWRKTWESHQVCVYVFFFFFLIGNCRCHKLLLNVGILKDRTVFWNSRGFKNHCANRVGCGRLSPTSGISASSTYLSQADFHIV